MKKFPIFDLSHGLTPLQKCEMGNYVKMVFYWLEKLFFLLEDHQTLFQAYFVQKQTTKRNSHFLTKIMGYPLYKNTNLAIM